MKLYILFACLLPMISCVPEARAATGPIRNKITVVIYDFEVLTPGTDATLAKAIPELLRSKLGSDGRIRILERSQMAKLFYEKTNGQKLPEIYAPPAASRVGKILTAEYSILGTLSKVRDRIFISARIVENETSIQTSGATASWQPREDLSKTADVLSQRLMAFLPNSNPSAKKAKPGKTMPQLQAPSTKSGYLSLKMTPPGGKAQIDGLPYLETPLVRKELSPGKHSVYISSDQSLYEGRLIEVEIAPGKVTDISVELLKKRGLLAIDADLQQAVVLIDGSYVENSLEEEMEVEVGQHDVTLLTSRGEVLDQAISIAPDSLSTMKFPKTGALRRHEVGDLIKQGEIGSRPEFVVTLDGLIIALDKSGVLEAFDAYTLQRRWRFTEYTIVGKPAIIGSKLYVLGRFTETTSAGRSASTQTYHVIEQLDPSTGRLISKYQPVTSDSAEVFVGSDSAVFSFSNEEVYVITPNMNEPTRVSWEIDPEERESLDWRSVLVSSGRVFINSTRGNFIYALTLSGAFSWKRYLRDEVREIEVCGGVVALGTEQDEILALSEETGASQWMQAVSHSPTRFLRCYEGKLLVLNQSGELWAFDPDDGSSRALSLTLPASGEVSACAVDPLGRLLVTLSGHSLTLYDTTLQAFTWLEPLAHQASLLSIGKGYIAAVSDRGQVSSLAFANRRKFLGWIESVDRDKGTIRMRSTGPIPKTALIISPRSFTMGTPAELPVAPSLTEIIGAGDDNASITLLPPERLRDIHQGDVVVEGGILVVRDPSEKSLIWVDDSFEGRGTRTLWSLSPGRHVIRAIGPRSTMFEQVVDLTPGEAFALDLALKDNQDASLSVLTLPLGAKIFADGKFEGTSPITLHGLTPNQSLKLRIENLGFKVVQEEIFLQGGTNQRRYEMRQARPLLRAFGLIGMTSAPPIIGWPAESIQETGPSGQPVLDRKSSLFGATVEAQYPFGNLAPFGSVHLFANQEGVDFEFGTYVLAKVVPLLGEIQLGLSSAWSSRSSSRPPDGNSFKSNNREAPLEDWDHPVPGVLIENSTVKHISVRLSSRPLPLVFWQFSAGTLLEAKLKGTALVPDDNGHLMRDPARRYSISAENGLLIDTNISFPLRWIVNLRQLPPSLTVRVGYRYGSTDFGMVSEETSSFNLGLGMVAFYWGKGRGAKAPKVR